MVFSKLFSMMCVAEIWLIWDREILPHGCRIFRKDRRSRGGGVLLAVTEHIPSTLDLLLCIDTVELIIVKVCIFPSFNYHRLFIHTSSMSHHLYN